MIVGTQPFCLNELGNIALALGDIATAQQHFEASYTLRKEFDDPGGMAVALNHLGEIALRQQDYERARQLYRKSLDLYQNIFDKGGLARAYKGLGLVGVRQGDFQTAERYLQQALRLAAEIDYVPLTLSTLNVMGELWLKTGRPERGLTVLTFVQHYPSSDHAAQVEAQHLLDQHPLEPRAGQATIPQAAHTQTQSQTLAEMVAQVIRAIER